MGLRIPKASAAAVVLLAVAGCEDSSTRDPQRPIISRIYRAPSGEMDVWRDRDTGCEYINYTSSGGMTARLGSDGRPICRNVHALSRGGRGE